MRMAASSSRRRGRRLKKFNIHGQRKKNYIKNPIHPKRRKERREGGGRELGTHWAFEINTFKNYVCKGFLFSPLFSQYFEARCALWKQKKCIFSGGQGIFLSSHLFQTSAFWNVFFYLNTEGCGAQRTQKNAFWLKLGVGEVDSHIFFKATEKKEPAKWAIKKSIFPQGKRRKFEKKYIQTSGLFSPTPLFPRWRGVPL